MIQGSMKKIKNTIKIIIKMETQNTGDPKTQLTQYTHVTTSQNQQPITSYTESSSINQSNREQEPSYGHHSLMVEIPCGGTRTNILGF